MEEEKGSSGGSTRLAPHTHGFSPLECTSFSSSFLFFSSYSSTLLRMARRGGDPSEPASTSLELVSHKLHSSKAC